MIIFFIVIFFVLVTVCSYGLLNTIQTPLIFEPPISILSIFQSYFQYFIFRLARVITWTLCVRNKSNYYKQCFFVNSCMIWHNRETMLNLKSEGESRKRGNGVSYRWSQSLSHMQNLLSLQFTSVISPR